MNLILEGSGFQVVARCWASARDVQRLASDFGFLFAILTGRCDFERIMCDFANFGAISIN